MGAFGISIVGVEMPAYRKQEQTSGLRNWHATPREIRLFCASYVKKDG